MLPNQHLGSCIVIFALVVLGQELETLEVISPDTERSGTCRATNEVIAGVFDHQPNILVPGEVHSHLDVFYSRGVDHIFGKSTLSAISNRSWGWVTRSSLGSLSQHCEMIINVESRKASISKQEIALVDIVVWTWIANSCRRNRFE